MQDQGKSSDSRRQWPVLKKYNTYYRAPNLFNPPIVVPGGQTLTGAYLAGTEGYLAEHAVTGEPVSLVDAAKSGLYTAGFIGLANNWSRLRNLVHNRNQVKQLPNNGGVEEAAANQAAKNADEVGEAGKSRYGSDISVKGGSGVNPNALKNNGDGTWISNEGLIYGQSPDGNRVIHVVKHTIPDPSKPLHTVFNVDKSNVIGLDDEAWRRRGTGIIQGNGNVFYDIDMGRTIGTNNESVIRIITRGYSNELITAFPKGGIK